MDVVSLCPLQAWGFVWQSHEGRSAQTVVVKATFALAPGQVTLAQEQDPLNEEDEHWNDDATRSVISPSDKAPYKLRADVMLVGHAYAPNKQPVRSLMVRLVVGDLDKSDEVFCDRGFRIHDNQLLEGQRFTSSRLSWERAAGGFDTNNPIGMRFDAPPDAYGIVAIPNLQPPGLFVSKRSDTFVPVGFGPIAASWQSRVQRLGRLAGSFPLPGWTERLLPEGLDPSFFQAAPPDQQVAEIRQNERIVLENLHPDHPRLVTSLPNLKPRASVERATGEREEVALIADTLLIDTDRGVCVVVWRGRIGLRHVQEAGRISVILEAEEMRPKLATLTPETTEEIHTPPSSGTSTVVPRTEMVPPKKNTLVPGFSQNLTQTGNVMPFRGAEQPAPRPSAPPARPSDAALPFVRVEQQAPSAAVPPWSFNNPTPPAAVAPATPFVAPPPAVVAPPPAVVAPAPVVPPAPPAHRASSPSISSSPWASGPPASGAGLGVGAALPVLAATSPASAGRPTGATAASDAAAEARAPSPAAAQQAPKPTAPAAPVAKPQRLPSSDVLDLLWYDDLFVPRIRGYWEKLVTDLDFEPADPRRDLSAEDPEKARCRHNVFGILSDGEMIDPSNIPRVISEAVNQKGRFTPPLALTGGELRFPFDEVETLRATIVAMTPFLGSDKKLKEMVDSMSELLKTPYLQGSTGIVDKLTRDLRAQFRESNRSLPATYLDGHVERLLLEQRRYSIRKVFGGEFIRALLTVNPPDGGSKGGANESNIPVYLPKHLDQTLPMLVVLKVRLIVEAHLQQDPYDANPHALRTVALGRVYQLDAVRGTSKAQTGA